MGKAINNKVIHGCKKYANLACVGGCDDDHCFRHGEQRFPDDSYKELMGDYGDSPVLRKAVETVDGRDKSDHYGPPEEFMGRLAKLWGGYLGMELKPTDAALMMALLKAARLRTNPDHEDSLVDFAGYARIYERVK